MKTTHNKMLRQTVESVEAIQWYAYNKKLIKKNLRMWEEELAEIKQRQAIKLSKVDYEHHSLYKACFTAMARDLVCELETRVRKLKSMLFKIKMMDTKEEDRPQHIDADVIRETVRIEDLCVKYGVELKKNMGLCPIHNDTDASFRIYPDSNSWYCFGACGSGGSVIDLVMKIDNCEFREALSKLSLTRP